MRSIRQAVAFLVTLAVLALVLTGCSRKTPIPSQASYPHLPEAANVIATLERKDYEGAVSTLVKMRAAVSTDEQEAEYKSLSRRVSDILFEAAPSDPKAAEAAQALTTLSRGR
jgi:hypothetical protein